MASANEKLNKASAGESIVELVEKNDQGNSPHSGEDEESDKHVGKVEMNLAMVDASSFSDDEDHDLGEIPAPAVLLPTKPKGVVQEI